MRFLSFILAFLISPLSAFAQCPLEYLIKGGFHFSSAAKPSLVGDNLGFYVTSIGDVDGDGITDFTADSFRDINYTHFGHSLKVWSGKTKNVIARFPISDVLSFYGEYTAGVSDLNGDGFRDILVNYQPIGSDPGKVFAYSVYPNPGLIYQINAPDFGPDVSGEGTFGTALAALDDLNGDGKQEYAVSADGLESLGDDFQGAVFILNGANGAILNTLVFEDDEVLDFGEKIFSLPDITGDGLKDLAVQATYTGNSDFQSFLTIYNGGSLHNPAVESLIDTIITQAPYLNFGDALTGLGDLTGDGLNEFAVGAADFLAQPSPPVMIISPVKNQNQISFALFKEIYTPDSEGSIFGTALALVRDYDGDSRGDIAISNPDYKDGRVDIFSTVTGQRLISLPTVFGDFSDLTGRSLAVLGDTDGDGYEEIAAGAPHDLDPVDFSGVGLNFTTGTAPEPGTIKIFSISRDLSGNGIPDACDVNSSVPGGNAPAPDNGGDSQDPAAQKLSRIRDLLNQALENAKTAKRSPASKAGKAAKKLVKTLINRAAAELAAGPSISAAEPKLISANLKALNKNFKKTFSKKSEKKQRNKAWKSFTKLIQSFLS